MTPEEIVSGLNDIDFSVKRMNKIIQHIRTFARQDVLKFSKVKIRETVDSALTLLGEQLRLRGIEVKNDVSAELPEITGDPFQLEQVWINMIVNARDALDEKVERVAKEGIAVKEPVKSCVSLRCTTRIQANRSEHRR